MARSFVKGTLTIKSVSDDKKAENVTLGNLVENASVEDVKAVRDVLEPLMEHPVTATQVTEVYAIN